LPTRLAPRWRLVVGVALCATMLTACGSDSGNNATTDTQPAITFPAAVTTTPPVLSDYDPAKAAPRWEQVKVVTGNVPLDIGVVTISKDAFQWRVKWSCEVGSMRITSAPPPLPNRPDPMVVDSGCPNQGEGFGRQTGDIRINIQASGPWKATVEQQVDTPLDEPPLPEMATARVLGRGDFYQVDRTGKGTAILYQLADGRRALRIEPGFEVVNDPDLVVWLSPLPSPKTAKEMSDAPHAEISALKSTKGSQNYIVPDNLPISDIRSVGLYCVPVPSIYIAAALS
jgi:hypothetical protein